MRLPDINNYKSGDGTLIIKQFEKLEKSDRNYNIFNDKDKIKLIKSVEAMIRSSMEYKDLIKYLKDSIDMTKCSFFNNIDSKNARRKISIEIHHEPFTLYDITWIVLNKQMSENENINRFLLANEVMQVHYQNLVGLVPLSLTSHELVHTGKLFIPLQYLYGNFTQFFETYSSFISDEMNDILQTKLSLSKEAMDNSILSKKFVYVEIDGFTLPQFVSKAS
jgi:hypothetical protein